MTDIFINKSIWNQFSVEQMAAYEDAVFMYYREHGFPYFDTSAEFRESEFRKLMNYESELIVDDTVKQNNAWTSTCMVIYATFMVNTMQ